MTKRNSTDAGLPPLFRQIIWPGEKRTYDFDCFEILQPQRIVSTQSRYKSGVFYSEKCQREIQYESGIELEFIRKMEESPLVHFYYEQPVQIAYRRGRRKATYTPDFAVFLRTREIVLIEIKDLSCMLEYRVQMRMEALVEYCHKKGFGVLMTDGKHTLDHLRKRATHRELEKEMLLRIREDRILRKSACMELLNKHQATQADLLKIILKNHWKYKAFPLKLEEDNRNQLFRHVFLRKKPYSALRVERFSTLFKNPVS